MSDKALEKIPRPSLQFQDRMVHQAKEILQDWGYQVGVVLKERIVADTDLHVLKLRCGVIERSYICSSQHKSITGRTGHS